MKKLFYLLFAPLLMLSACEENVYEEDAEYANWQQRNESYFLEKMATARAAIASAREAYGADWEAHCSWRMVRNYLLAETYSAATTDTVCIEVLRSGDATLEHPLSTDYAVLSYLKRLIPSDSYAEGKVIDHTGITTSWDDIFVSEAAASTTRLVSNNTVGETSALMHMRPGDVWRLYIPTQLAYNATETSAIPAYSTIVADIHLHAFSRP